MARFIILIIVLVLALSYFGISIREIAQSPTGQDNITFVWAYVKDGWELFTTFLAGLIESVKQVFS